jgi:hypothetical protein
MKYCHPQDAKIVDDVRDNTKGEKLLYNCDGDLLFAFPNDWTEEHVMKALDFANEAFERGNRYGRSDKAYELRKALGMTS